MKICTYYVLHIDENIRWLCKGKSRCSGRAAGYWSWWRHQQCNAAEVTDIIASHSIAVHDHLEWTNGWLLICAAQGSWTCCWRNATSIPASWSDPLPRERVRNLGPRGDGVASFMVLTIPDTRNWKHHKPTHMNNKMRKMSMCQKPIHPSGGRHLYGNAPLRDVWVL